MPIKEIWKVFSGVGAADLLDMAIVAMLAYYILVWFKRTKTAFVATGIGIFTALYLIAKTSGMYLTTWIFQGFFAVFLLALVVIFQEELRSFFERLAVWSLGRRESIASTPKIHDMLVRVASDLARARVGALIVLQGRDRLERHLEGGSELDGKLSEALLKSLFDPHSEGHDGAVVIEKGRLTRFGVHLPLSKDFAQLRGLGTRHAAALGLAERADAFCIVLSEEKGLISVAWEGRLRTLRDPAELDELLSAFMARKSGPQPEPKTQGWLSSKIHFHLRKLPWIQALAALETHLAVFLQERLRLPAPSHWSDLWSVNLKEKLIALSFSVALWLVFVKGFKPITHYYDMPIVLQELPKDLKVVSLKPDNVRVTLAGLERDFEMLRPRNLKVYVNLSEARPQRQRIELSRDNLRIPDALRWGGADPAFVEIELAPRAGHGP